MPNAETSRLLGYAADARLLILNADDFGMYEAVNAATLRTLTEGVVRSTSLMVPCPAASQAMQLLGSHPALAFGIHLTVICDLPAAPWGPLAPHERVRSLVDETGLFFSYERIPDLLAQAQLDDLEVEFRAQIEAVLAANLTPTHLDWHCLPSGGRPDIFDLTYQLAKEYRLALRVARQPWIEQVQRQGLPTVDHVIVDSYDLELGDKAARYAQLLRDLPVGLSEWAVHPGLGTPEAQAIDPEGWQVRQSDFDFFISPQARDIIRQEGIVVLNYTSLQEVWRGRKA